MTALRYAIWAVVFTETQAAEDKASLPVQQEACRQVITGRGWKETAGLYVVLSASRARWGDLRDAEQAIPELRRLLDDAHAGRFNLLVLYDFNRLRDLLDPYALDTSAMTQGLSQIISRPQISDLRRKYRYAMPRRVTELGPPAISIPYGYAKPPGRGTDRKAVPVQLPEEIAVLQRIRHMYLYERLSSRTIADALSREGIPSRRGLATNAITIRGILANPFYVGRVAFGKIRARTDPRTGRRSHLRGIPRRQWSEGQGDA